MEDKDLKKEVAKYWDEGSKEYDTYPGHGMGGDDEKEAWLKFLKEIIPEGTKKVLDVGCGTGFLTVLLAELGYTVKGIDLSEGMQAEAKRKISEGGFEDRVTFEICDAENTNEPDDSYDLVINRHLLWTLPHPYEAVDEWIRVTKPGGCVIVIDGDWSLGKKAAEEGKLKEQKKDDEDDKKRSYSKEVTDSLPLNDASNRPWDYINRAGYDIEVVELTDVDELERHKYVDNEWIAGGFYKRDAFIIKK